jgi:hypothetical protein
MNLSILVSCLVLMIPAAAPAAGDSDPSILVSLQKRIPAEQEEGAFILVNEIQEWKASETDAWHPHRQPCF